MHPLDPPSALAGLHIPDPVVSGEDPDHAHEAADMPTVAVMLQCQPCASASHSSINAVSSQSSSQHVATRVPPLPVTGEASSSLHPPRCDFAQRSAGNSLSGVASQATQASVAATSVAQTKLTAFFKPKPRNTS